MGAIQYKLNSLLYYVLLLTVSFFATLIGVVANLCGQRFNTNYYVARTFYWTAGPILGWDFDVSGEEHFKSVESGEQPAVILGNHQKYAATSKLLANCSVSSTFSTSAASSPSARRLWPRRSSSGFLVSDGSVRIPARLLALKLINSDALGIRVHQPCQQQVGRQRHAGGR